MSHHAAEVERGERFEFGANWTTFLSLLNDERIAAARSSLCSMLDVATLEGKSFLDVGSGSGLFSLAACSLGAKVHSFDYDPKSVECTQELKRRYSPESDWAIEVGSVLDRGYLSRLGQFDVVYSWGVLHHTGRLRDAMENIALLVRRDGRLFVAIYNDQGRASRRWLAVKKTYNTLPSWMRVLVVVPAFMRLWFPTLIRDSFRGMPLQTWTKRKSERGMSPWRDVVDWVGGYPFEVAKPEEIFDVFRAKGFRLEKLVTCGGGLGCNELVFRKV